MVNIPIKMNRMKKSLPIVPFGEIMEDLSQAIAANAAALKLGLDIEHVYQLAIQGMLLEFPNPTAKELRLMCAICALGAMQGLDLAKEKADKDAAGN